MALFVFLLMLYVSQSGAVRVKVYKGKESVSLPFIIRPLNMDMDPSALWTREGSSTETVHIRVKKGDDLRSQSPQFKGRTEMKNDSLKTGDLSLTLTHPTVSDSGVYTCEVREEITVVGRTSVQLIVIGEQVTAREGAESVSLSFIMRPLNISKDPSAQWTREGSEVHRRVKEGDDLRLQRPQYKGRTQMNPDALQTGDLSLLLFKTTTEDSGIYTCTVREGSTETQRIVVEVTIEPIPPSRPGSIIAGVVVLVAFGGLVGFWFYRKKWMSKGWVTRVNVREGAEFVSLPFTLWCGLDMKKNPSVMWTRLGHTPDLVHHRVESDDLSDQSPQFKGRTTMKERALQTGDLSLTLRHPTASDSGLYYCQALDEKFIHLGHITVELIVIKIIVCGGTPFEGDESVSLPCNMSNLDVTNDPSAKWTREGRTPDIVHLIYMKGDDFSDQSPRFNGRTLMRPDALQTGDLSLTLKKPTPSDKGTYTCVVKQGILVVGHITLELIFKERTDDDSEVENLMKKKYGKTKSEIGMKRNT